MKIKEKSPDKADAFSRRTQNDNRNKENVTILLCNLLIIRKYMLRPETAEGDALHSEGRSMSRKEARAAETAEGEGISSSEQVGN